MNHMNKPTPAALAVSRREAAAMLGISERLLWTWTNASKIPHVRIGTRVLYPVEQLRRWLDARSGTESDSKLAIASRADRINDPEP